MSVPQDDLADDFNGSSGSGCMGGGMTSQVMGPQIHTHHLARLFDHHPSSIVGDRENALLGPNSFILDIFLKSDCDFLGNVYDFRIPPTFGVRQCDLAVLDIDRFDFKHLTDPHSALGHQLHHDPVAKIGRFKNNFINQVFFDDLPLLWTSFPEYLFQDRRVTGIFDLKIDGVAYVIEEGFEAGVTVAFGGLFGSFSESGQKGQNLILGDGIQISVTKFVVKAGKKEFIIF